MAPSALSSPGTFVPSCAQAALALVILQSKPPTAPVRDYVLQLRARIRRGQDPFSSTEQSQYLDLVTYWQEQYRRAQEECNQLRSLNVKLERSNQQLSSQTSATPDPRTISRGSKRKAPTALSAKTKKRPKPPPQKISLQNVAEAQHTIENDEDFLGALGDDGTTLTEALFTTHNLCRAIKPDAETLCCNLVRTCSALSRVIRLVAYNHEQLSCHGQKTQGAGAQDQDKTDFSIALSICARAFMSILVGTATLADSGADKRLPSLVVCELTSMFKLSLASVETSALRTSQVALSELVQARKDKDRAPAITVKESAAARSVAHLLISFLGFLEKTDSIHEKIFDGFLFVLFERIGKQLYYCTFGRHRSTTVEGNIISMAEPLDTAGISKRETEALAARLEMKALVLILERAMGLAPNHMNPRTGQENKPPNRLTHTLTFKNLPTASRARLGPIAKDRLQRTLITCMYGHRSDDEFLDVLTKPLPAIRLGSLQNVAKIDDKDVEGWYKHEVWRLIGWDILAKESGW